MDGLNDESAEARLTFFNGLTAFLPTGKRQETLQVAFKSRPAVKHLIESLGIPHTEVARVMANGQEVGLGYHVQPGDVIGVYPPLPVNGHSHNREVGPRLEIEPRFILDNHLGRLAAYLRLLGFDSLYRNDYQDEELAQVAGQDERILLTRDRRLLMRNSVRYGYCVQTLDPHTQITEVVRRYNLASQVRPFQRCLRCNAPLEPVEKAAILDRLEPLTRQYFNEFSICPACQQIYWKGSHYQHMQALIEEATR